MKATLKGTKPSGDRRHWSLEQIPYESIERNETTTDSEVFYLLTAASFVEITSDLYAQKLVDYCHDDKEVSGWLEGQWQREELQHGSALRHYVITVWPDFDWHRAYGRFYREYSHCCDAKSLGPTPALEMVSRCVVETGTASLYTMLHRMGPEPVLRVLTGHIKNDEVRHYKHFYRYFLRYREREKVPRSAVLRTLCKRIAEINDEDAYCAFKHVFLECHPRRCFDDADYRKFSRHWRQVAKNYYPYEMAVKMSLKPLGLGRWMKRTTVPLLVTGARYLS